MLNTLQFAPPKIADVIGGYPRVYYSFSGGRDSLAAMMYVHKEAVRLGIPGEALYVDTGAELPELLPYIIRTTKELGIQLTILNGKKFFEVFDGVWPRFNSLNCITKLIAAPIDEYCSKSGEPFLLVRGGRAAQKAGHSKSSTIQRMKRNPLLTIYNPLFDIPDYEYKRFVSGLPLWNGYKRGFERTACWCCPFQKPGQWDALKRDYPVLWDRLREMSDSWRFSKNDNTSIIAKFIEYWNNQ